MLICTVKKVRPLLQNHIYGYEWSRKKKVVILNNEIEQRRIDKHNGFEVARFIARFMNKHHLNKVGHIYIIENTLQIKELAYITDINKLIARIERILGL